jgi:NAD+ synthase
MRDVSKAVGIITNWLRKQPTDGFVVGVSGGIDSAVVSTLCGMSAKPVRCISMPIYQKQEQVSLAMKHMAWLKGWCGNVTIHETDLSNTFESFKNDLFKDWDDVSPLTLANLRSRIRMAYLYCYANQLNYMVAGTGNRVEDYGVGFFTKYGDGGVDISPIGELTKTEVWQLGRILGVSDEIIDAKPTDGLWDDGRGDEDQIGASYEELEWAMETFDSYGAHFNHDLDTVKAIISDHPALGTRQKQILTIYAEKHINNSHKMQMPPVCKLGGYL